MNSTSGLSAMEYIIVHGLSMPTYGILEVWMRPRHGVIDLSSSLARLLQGCKAVEGNCFP